MKEKNFIYTSFCNWTWKTELKRDNELLSTFSTSVGIRTRTFSIKSAVWYHFTTDAYCLGHCPKPIHQFPFYHPKGLNFKFTIAMVDFHYVTVLNSGGRTRTSTSGSWAQWTSFALLRVNKALSQLTPNCFISIWLEEYSVRGLNPPLSRERATTLTACPTELISPYGENKERVQRCSNWNKSPVWDSNSTSAPWEGAILRPLDEQARSYATYQPVWLGSVVH